MPGGKYDSSKTRVRPVFDQLWQQGRDWLPALLALPSGVHPSTVAPTDNLRLLEGHWEPDERPLRPPVALLSWLIRNVGVLTAGRELEPGHRQHLAEGDPQTVLQGLDALRSPGDRGWWILEGPTCPDVFLAAEDALVVIEGKRTEPTATTSTTWLEGRHQIWRHIDAAWEIRGRRSVYGFFIVEGSDVAPTSVPAPWRAACAACCSPEALASSFPHRSSAEIDAISKCFLGVTTWQAVCQRFGVDWRSLPDAVP
jgi:hypothetical protein